MKEQIIYIAEDGRRFDDKEKCQKYDKALDEIKEIMSLLVPREKYDIAYPDGNFSDGAGYIQQDKKILEEVESRLCYAIERYHKFSEWIDWRPEQGLGGMLGRYLDGVNSPFYSTAYFRWACIDSMGREWGQPYYVRHEGRLQRLNK